MIWHEKGLSNSYPCTISCKSEGSTHEWLKVFSSKHVIRWSIHHRWITEFNATFFTWYDLVMDKDHFRATTLTHPTLRIHYVFDNKEVLHHLYLLEQSMWQRYFMQNSTSWTSMFPWTVYSVTFLVFPGILTFSLMVLNLRFVFLGGWPLLQLTIK